MGKREIPKWFQTHISEEVSDSTLFRFSIEISGKKISVDMRADLDIDYGVIQQLLEDTPSEFAYWAAIYSELKQQVAIYERKVKARRGKLAQRLVDDAATTGARLTDKQIQILIEGDDQLNQLEAKYILLQKHCGKMYFMIEAIRIKSDNLRSLAGFARIEFEKGA